MRRLPNFRISNWSMPAIHSLQISVILESQLCSPRNHNIISTLLAISSAKTLLDQITQSQRVCSNFRKKRPRESCRNRVSCSETSQACKEREKERERDTLKGDTICFTAFVNALPVIQREPLRIRVYSKRVADCTHRRCAIPVGNGSSLCAGARTRPSICRLAGGVR